MENNESEEEKKTFKELGVCDVLCETMEKLGWKAPTKIQNEVYPVAFQGKDIIGLAETGSGKTAAFIIPILQALLDQRQNLFSLIITPTRELAIQIQDQVKALGNAIGIKSVVLIGGGDEVREAISLANSPHIVVATPGRLMYHLKKTKV